MLKRFNFAEFVIISLVLHCLVVVIISIPKSSPPVSQPVTVEILTAPPPPPVAQKAPAVPRPKPIPMEKQIVEQDEKKSTEEAPDTKFLSAQNQKVLKQTVSKNKGEFKNSKKKAEASKSESKSWSLAPKLNAADTVAPEGLKKAEKGGDEGKTQEKAEQADASASSDYIKDVDEGLETLLNAREFKYYTYYNRIRRQLAQHWESKVKGKLSAMFKQGRYMASDSDRITKLIVILDTQGNLVKVQVLKESGVTDLDEAATEAFQLAAPFPNPPAGIIDPDGTVKIRWDFVLEG